MEEKTEIDLPLLNSKKKSLEKTDEPCLVCSTPTQKLHLQVNVCYACAAFYRRSLDSYKNYRCQRNNEKCDLTVKKEGKTLCRLCRYKKCVKVGLVVNKKEDQKGDDYLADIINLPDISDASADEDVLIDMEKNFKDLREIFMKNVGEPPDKNFNYTKEFTKLISNFVEAFKPTVTLLPFGGYKSVTKKCFFDNKRFFATAKMLSKFPPFSAIPIDDKISIFCHFFNIFRLFEGIYQAILYFNNIDENDFRVQCCFDEYYDINDTKSVYVRSTPNPTFYSLMLPVFLKGKLLISTFKKVNPTFDEFVYMCHTSLWSCHELLQISPETQKLADKITNIISEDLHNYYFDELRIASYSSRQAQLFKLISLAEVVYRSKKQMLAGRKLFNFGQFQFPYCKFESNLFDYIDKNQL